MLARAERWAIRSYRQVWLIALALVVVTCVQAALVPAKRQSLPWAVLSIATCGMWATGRLDKRGKEQAVAAASHYELPAEVVGLVAAGKKIHAIKRYRDLSGLSLQEAKVRIYGR
jgi:ribosomal protein L7/L12